jgi:hypothetical protein
MNGESAETGFVRLVILAFAGMTSLDAIQN